MKHIKVVLGANFGDEGKGLMTHYFSKNAEGKVLNVLFNGGVQRGHTVNDHVFHCFGSGTFDGAATFYHKDFMVNPIGWVIESGQLGFEPELYMDKTCRVTLPHDTLINQEIEDSRGNNRHGSCGMGILETRVRSEEYPILTEDLKDQFSLYNKLKLIENEWIPKRCKELGIDIIDCNGLIDDFLIACNSMMKNISFQTFHEIQEKFDTVIFEGGQGLLLSEDNEEYFPNLTPSFTGSQIISKEINKYDVDVEVCYVTRSYMTRHGAGKFPTECNKEDINPDIVDKTNQPNQYQEELRYGYLDIDDLILRTRNDVSYYKNSITYSLAITQLNYTDGHIILGRNNKLHANRVLTCYNRLYTFYSEEI